MAENPPTNQTQSLTTTADVQSEGDESTFDIVFKELSLAGKWLVENPLPALLLATCLATFYFFFDGVHLFRNNALSSFDWARTAWNHENNQEYGALVFPIAVGLIVYHWRALRLAPKGSSQRGLAWLGSGVIIYIASVRCLQPRMALFSLPFLLYGTVLFVWGKAVARQLLFPFAFLLFMIPVGAIEQATNNLQFIITGLIGILTHFIGIGIHAVGTSLTATDGSFDFEIAEGCSGIRSLAAMTMITAVYVHLTQKQIWKMAVILAASVLFAIAGNVGRIFSVVLVAKYYDPKFAGGLYHDYSGFLFFPIALMAMLGFEWLVNLDFSGVQKLAHEVQTKAKAATVEVQAKQAKSMAKESVKVTKPQPKTQPTSRNKPVTYDY